MVHQRPVMCYQCGKSIGTIETTMSPKGMEQFRIESQRLREQHTCQGAEEETNGKKKQGKLAAPLNSSVQKSAR